MLCEKTLNDDVSLRFVLYSKAAGLSHMNKQAYTADKKCDAG